MATIFKKFSEQDYHIIPFNAHKQYSFNSGSASTNSINVFNARYTSESISLYSSASTNPDGLLDNINNVKYNQIDHLFYKDFLTGRVVPGSAGVGIDPNIVNINYDFLNHKRELHKHVNIISMPVGTYGHSIKKGTFIVSASNYITPHSSSTSIVDDSKGNLIISGTNLDDYITDCRQNILNIGPAKGFKRYDLNTIGDIHPYDKNGHLIHSFIEEPTGRTITIGGVTYPETTTGYIKYLRGAERVNVIEEYTSPRNIPTYNVDDSYYLNPISYVKIKFSEQDLFIVKETANNSSSLSGNFDSNFIIEADRFPVMDFTGKSEIKLVHDPKFNFNKNEDFTINFWMKNAQKIGNLSIGNYTIKPDNKQYILSKSTTKTVINTPMEGAAQTLNTNTTGSSQEVDINAENRFPFEVFIDKSNSNDFIYFSRSDGEITPIVSASITSFSSSSKMQHITCRYSASQMEIFINGIGSGISGSDTTSKPTQNNANLYIGNKGGLYYNHITKEYQIPTPDDPNRNIHNFIGSLSQINIFDEALTDTQVKNHYSSSNGSPYVGNIFYSHGIATITHPSHQRLLYHTTYNKDLDVENRFSFDLDMLGFQGQIDSSEMDAAGSTDLTTQGGGDVFIKPDGTKAYIDGGQGQIAQFILSTPYDISSATFEKHSPEFKFIEPTFTETSGDSHGITFNNDGSKVYIANARRRMITEISLTSSFDVGTFHTSKSINIASASYLNGDDVSGAQFNSLDLNFSMSRHPNNAFFLQGLDDVPAHPRFNTSGDKLYFMHKKRAVLYEMQLSESFDIGSHKCFITGSGNTTFGLSGSSEADNRRETHILMKDLSKQSSGSFKAGGTNITATTNDVPGGFTFSPDGKHLLAANTENDTINHFFLSSSFDINTIYPNLNNRRKFLPLKSETIETGIISAEGVKSLHWVEVTGSKITPSGSDSRLYVSIQDRDNRTGDNIYEYHISKSEIHNIRYQGTHLIYEHEYQCSVDEHEYNNTYNISARKIPSSTEETIATFATGSLFKPFVTTIGLYNENRELLVVGKLGSPIRMSDETDTTFVLRWDV